MTKLSNQVYILPLYDVFYMINDIPKTLLVKPQRMGQIAATGTEITCHIRIPDTVTGYYHLLILAYRATYVQLEYDCISL